MRGDVLDGKVVAHSSTFWATGTAWWTICAKGVLGWFIVAEAEGYTIRTWDEDNGATPLAGPFDTLEAAYAAWEMMDG